MRAPRGGGGDFHEGSRLGAKQPARHLRDLVSIGASRQTRGRSFHHEPKSLWSLRVDLRDDCSDFRFDLILAQRRRDDGLCSPLCVCALADVDVGQS